MPDFLLTLHYFWDWKNASNLTSKVKIHISKGCFADQMSPCIWFTELNLEHSKKNVNFRSILPILAHFRIISKFIYYVNIISDIYEFFADLYVSHLWFICKSLKHKSLDSIIQIWNNIQGCMTPIIMQNSCMISECCYPFNQFIKCIRDPRWANIKSDFLTFQTLQSAKFPMTKMYNTSLSHMSKFLMDCNLENCVNENASF